MQRSHDVNAAKRGGRAAHRDAAAGADVESVWWVVQVAHAEDVRGDEVGNVDEVADARAVSRRVLRACILRE